MRPCRRRRRRRSSSVGLVIQRLTPSDPARLDRLAETHQAAFAPTARGWSGDEIANLARTGLLLADDGDRGFALFSRAADEAELLTIAVHPDHRRRGLARGLLMSAEDALMADGARLIHLEVAADNPGAIALYEAQGYRVSGRRKQYYRRGPAERVDAVMMVKDLAGA